MQNGPVTITDVITPATDYDLVSLCDVKGDLGVTTTADDAYLKRRIAELSSAAMQYMNRTLQVETVRDRFWPQRDPYPWQLPGGAMPLQLSRWPIAGPTVVTENETALVEDEDYVVDAERGQLSRMFAVDTYVTRWATLPIIVEYAAGFDPIPPEISGAISRSVRAQYLGRTRDPAIKSQSAAGIYAATYLSGGAMSGPFTPDVLAVFDAYRIPVVA